MISLAEKRFLLITPSFFGYHTDIISEIRARGGIVDWLPDRPFDHSIGKAISRFAPDALAFFAENYYSNLLSSFGASRFHYILVINGQTVSKAFLRKLRSIYPGAKFILYLWDSVANRRNIPRKFSLFDSIFSFDPRDASYYSLSFRPLFYGPQFSLRPALDSIAFDLSFIGTVHSDRYSIVHSLRRQLTDVVSSYFFLYLQSPWMYYFYRLKPGMRRAKFNEFSFVPLPKAAIDSIFRSSRSVLDISHPRQTGLTMRTFEALGSGKKLLTTNVDIRNYDFFDERNIYIVDRRSPRLDLDFIRSEYSSVNPLILGRYSLSGWLDEVVGLVPPGDSVARKHCLVG